MTSKTPPKTTGLELFVIYDRPKDFPDYFVVRRFINDQPQDLLAVCSTLKAVREHIPPGLICLARSPTDEPQIVETWV